MFSSKTLKSQEDPTKTSCSCSGSCIYSLSPQDNVKMNEMIRPSRSKNRFTVTERTSVKLEVSTGTVFEKSTEIEVSIKSNSSSCCSNGSQCQECLCDFSQSPFFTSFEQAGNHKNHNSNCESQNLPLSMLAMVENMLNSGRASISFSEPKEQIGQRESGSRRHKTQKSHQHSNHLLTSPENEIDGIEKEKRESPGYLCSCGKRRRPYHLLLYPKILSRRNRKKACPEDCGLRIKQHRVCGALPAAVLQAADAQLKKFQEVRTKLCHGCGVTLELCKDIACLNYKIDQSDLDRDKSLIESIEFSLKYHTPKMLLPPPPSSHADIIRIEKPILSSTLGPELVRVKERQDVGVQVKLLKKSRISKKEKIENLGNDNKRIKYCKNSTCLARQRIKNNVELNMSEISMGSSCICDGKYKCQCRTMSITYRKIEELQTPRKINPK